jgi:hypothetical protein
MPSGPIEWLLGWIDKPQGGKSAEHSVRARYMAWRIERSVC